MFPASLFSRSLFPGALFPALAAAAGGGDVVVPWTTISLTIAGVQRDAVLASLRLRNPANGLATLDCEIDSVDSSYRPALDEELVLNDGVTRLFGGLVVDLDESGLAGEPLADSITTRVTAHGYMVRAERSVANGIFPAGTLKSKLQQLLADIEYPLPGISLHPDQADGPILPENAFLPVKTKDFLDELSLLSGWPYEIDDLARLRFMEPGSLSAGFDIVDGDEHTVGDITVKPTRAQYYNRVIVMTPTLSSIQEDAGEVASRGLYAVVVQAPPETTQDAANALALAILARSLPTLKQVTYQTYLGGVYPGRTQQIQIADRNINNTFLIGDVDTFFDGPVIKRRVTAVEGLVYQAGWREQFKNMFGGKSLSTAGFVGGGGGAGVTRFAYPLGGSGEAAVESSVPTWVPASEFQVQVNTVPRGTLSASVFVRLKALSAGVSVQARIFDVTDSVACAGLSTVVNSTTFQMVTFVATLTSGSHFYRLEVLPGAANEPVVAAGGYLE